MAALNTFLSIKDPGPLGGRTLVMTDRYVFAHGSIDSSTIENRTWLCNFGDMVIVKDLFGDQWTNGLCAFHLALNLRELAASISAGNKDKLLHLADLHSRSSVMIRKEDEAWVPETMFSFLFEDRETMSSATSLLARTGQQLDALWSAFPVDRPQMCSCFPGWMAQFNRWINASRRVGRLEMTEYSEVGKTRLGCVDFHSR